MATEINNMSRHIVKQLQNERTDGVWSQKIKGDGRAKGILTITVSTSEL